MGARTADWLTLSMRVWCGLVGVYNVKKWSLPYAFSLHPNFESMIKQMAVSPESNDNQKLLNKFMNMNFPPFLYLFGQPTVRHQFT